MIQSTETASVTATGAERLVSALEQLGVTLVFGLPGVHNLSIWDALARSPIRLVGVRHEQTAVYAADGYARATGALGVAVVTTGPGAANTLGATGEAMASGSPVLVIATDIPAALRREGVYRGVLHETRDQAAMFKPVTKLTRVAAGPEEIAQATLDGGSTATAAPSGPVYLGVPTDLLSSPVSATLEPRETETHSHQTADDAAISRAAQLLGDAERPLIWAGGGALRAQAGEIVGDVALRLAAPVITTYMSRGLLSPEHPCFVPGPVHAPAVGALWDEADVVLAVGTDFDGMMTQNWLMPRPPTLVAVNVDAADANKNFSADLTLVGDARAVLEPLLEQLRPEAPEPGGLPALERRLAQIATGVAAFVESDDAQANRMLEILGRALPPDAVLVADMCIPGYWLAGFWPAPRPRKLAYPVGWGTLGFAFPASIGACLAGAGPTVCVCGDGGFLFACGELATIAQERVPLTIVLIDDGGYGMLRFDQARSGRETFGVDLSTPDFVVMADAFGIPATPVDSFGPPFEQALARAVASDGPEMIVVRAALKPPPTTSPRWYRRA
jgi:thiamine pyrophosphate-dependent acetolactate synthase large subunit-like protein